MEKHIAQQTPIHHNFIDFKKAFNRVWHVGLCDTMTFFGIDIKLINIIRAHYRGIIYEATNISVLLTNQIVTHFYTKVGVR